MAMAGFTWAMSFLKLMNLYSAKGITLLAKKKAPRLNNKIKTVELRIALLKDIPDDLIAANS